ncbi:MAG: inosine/xanthosine triphosphatase, partial [Acidilobaceae archaeon]
MEVVAVGSLNPVKVRAVEKAFSRFLDVIVRSVKVTPTIPRQPVGSREILLGALERAIASVRLVGEAAWGVGVEAGPMEFYSSSGFLETQVAVIVDRECKVSIGLSPSFELSPSTIELMISGLELLQTMEIPRAMGDLGDLIGYVGYATEGHVTRMELTEAAVLMALIP